MKNQVFGQPPKASVGFLLARVLRDAEDARQHANDIAVENWRGLIERDTADRAGGVAADAGQGENVVKGFGKLEGRALRVPDFTLGVVELRPPIIGNDLPGGFLHVADARVITEPFPEFVNLRARSIRE